MIALPVLVDCETYHARLTLSACIARHKRAEATGDACPRCPVGARRANPDAPVARVKSKRKHPLRLCTHPGCTNKHMAKGFCDMHYHRQKIGAAMDAPPRAHFEVGGPCSMPGCTHPAKTRGLCKMHYGRHWRARAQTPANDNANPVTQEIAS